MKGEVVHSRRTALRSVSARAKKRFPVRVECRSSHRRSENNYTIHRVASYMGLLAPAKTRAVRASKSRLKIDWEMPDAELLTAYHFRFV